MNKILLIGDSWIDYITEFDDIPEIEIICLPGASLYEIRDNLLIELERCCEYNVIIVVGGRNGGYIDGVFDEISCNLHIIRNDVVENRYLQKDGTHPNKKGVSMIVEKIREHFRQQ